VAEELDRHADHDPSRVAALVDRSAETRDPVARAWIASCPACADLYADLLVLTVSMDALPRPTRPRDYTITASQAARLSDEVERHAGHDPLLVAGLLDRMADSADRSAAERLIATCAACAEMHSDLLAISSGIQAMGAPARTREFTLTVGDAARLRPSGLRRYLAGLGTSRDRVTRPLAIGFTTLGLVGVLVAGAPAMLPVGSATSGTTHDAAGAPAEGVGAARVPAGGASSMTTSEGSSIPPAFIIAPESADAVKASPPTAQSENQDLAPDVAGGNGESRDTAGELPQPEPNGSTAEPAETGSATSTRAMLLSATFLAVGIGLFAARWGARRLRHG
jgi:hypothetical protein